MKNETIIAITKAISGKSKQAKNARDALTVGKHHVDQVVRIVGDLTVGEDYEMVPTASLMSVDFLLMTLKAAGVTRSAAIKAIDAVASEYLVDWTGSKEDKVKAKEARANALKEYDPEGKGKAVFDEFKKTLPKIPAKGKVSFKGNVEEVREEENAISVVGDKVCEASYIM